MIPPERDSGQSVDLTTMHVRRAIQGEEESLNWVVERFTPVLLLQATCRLRGQRLRVYDPEDLVAEVWQIVLPRLPRLQARDGRWTPVLVKYLGTTLLHRVNNALRRHIRRRKHQHSIPPPSDGTGGEDVLDRISAGMTGIASHIGRQEMYREVHETIRSLCQRDMEVIVLRAIEQFSNTEAARILGEEPGTVATRYWRALQRLRAALPDSVFDEFEENP